jgi:hypothetical protein
MSAEIEAAKQRIAAARSAEAKSNTHCDQTHNIFTIVNVFVDIDGERGAHHGIDKESRIVLRVLGVILDVLGLGWCSLHASGTTWCHGSCPPKNYLSAVVVGVLLPTEIHTLAFCGVPNGLSLIRDSLGRNTSQMPVQKSLPDVQANIPTRVAQRWF